MKRKHKHYPRCIGREQSTSTVMVLEDDYFEPITKLRDKPVTQFHITYFLLVKDLSNLIISDICRGAFLLMSHSLILFSFVIYPNIVFVFLHSRFLEFGGVQSRKRLESSIQRNFKLQNDDHEKTDRSTWIYFDFLAIHKSKYYWPSVFLYCCISFVKISMGSYK